LVLFDIFIFCKKFNYEYKVLFFQSKYTLFSAFIPPSKYTDNVNILSNSMLLNICILWHESFWISKHYFGYFQYWGLIADSKINTCITMFKYCVCGQAKIHLKQIMDLSNIFNSDILAKLCVTFQSVASKTLVYGGFCVSTSAFHVMH